MKDVILCPSPVRPHGYESQVVLAACRPEGKRIVTASTDETARAWNAEAQRDPIVLQGHADKVWPARANVRREVAASNCEIR
jgi:WD40 repeat protein